MTQVRRICSLDNGWESNAMCRTSVAAQKMVCARAGTCGPNTCCAEMSERASAERGAVAAGERGLRAQGPCRV